jgi:hypothetical protein
MGPQAGFERRVLSALEASPSRIPVLLGGCGTGRTWLLQRLRDRGGRDTTQYIDVERAASTPERFYRAVVGGAPFARTPDDRAPTSAREAFDALLAFFDTSRGPDGGPTTFLLDEALELRTFESFPGLRHALRELLESLSKSDNRFAIATRYVARAHWLLRDASARFEVMHLPPLSAVDVSELLSPAFNRYDQMGTDDREHLGRAVVALTDGRPVYVRAVGEALTRMNVPDPISALTALLTADGALNHWCRFRYELRLHRARGYGALKAILEILSAEEPLTLTEVAHRLGRTPGSTKDYLSWLEDVDLVTARQKRYRFTDPLLRLWVRVNCRPTPPSDDDVAREVQAYALARVPSRTAAPALAYAAVDSGAEDRRGWGIIEID